MSRLVLSNIVHDIEKSIYQNLLVNNTISNIYDRFQSFINNINLTNVTPSQSHVFKNIGKSEDADDGKFNLDAIKLPP